MSLDHFNIVSAACQMCGEDIEHLIKIKRTFNGISGIDKYCLQKETIFIHGMEFVVRRLCSTSFESGPYGVVGWVLDEDIDRCMICGVEFGFFRHRHHCRACGNIVCYECSPDEAIITEIRELEEQRVCVQCCWGQDPVDAKHSRIAEVALEQATKRWTDKLQSAPSAEPIASPTSRTAAPIDYWGEDKTQKQVSTHSQAVAEPVRYMCEENDSDCDDTPPATTTPTDLSQLADRDSTMLHEISVPSPAIVSQEKSVICAGQMSQGESTDPIAARVELSQNHKEAVELKPTQSAVIAEIPVGHMKEAVVGSTLPAQEISSDPHQARPSDSTPKEQAMKSQRTALSPIETKHQVAASDKRNETPVVPHDSSAAVTAIASPTTTTGAEASASKTSTITTTASNATAPTVTLTGKASPAAAGIVHETNAAVKQAVLPASATPVPSLTTNSSVYAPLEAVDATDEDAARREAQHRSSNHVPFVVNPLPSSIDDEIPSQVDDAIEQLPKKESAASTITAKAVSDTVPTANKVDTMAASPISNVSITPQAVCVLKSRRGSGEKVFVNVLSFPMQLILGNRSYCIDKDIVWLHGDCKRSSDKNGDMCLTYDVVISDGAEKDTAVGTMSLQELGMRVITEINIQFQDSLALEFTTPKIRNNYKGDGPQPMSLFGTNGKLFQAKADAEKHSIMQKEHPTEIRFLRTNSIPDNPLPEGLPSPHFGYLRKEGHLIRNWKRRYFTLIGGVLQYYEKANKAGEGEKLKGGLSLKGAVVNTSGGDKEYDSKKLYITAGENGKDLFLEADSAAECVEWRNALFMHIEYATNNSDFVETPRDSKASRLSVFG